MARVDDDHRLVVEHLQIPGPAHSQQTRSVLDGFEAIQAGAPLVDKQDTMTSRIADHQPAIIKLLGAVGVGQVRASVATDHPMYVA